MNIASRLTEVEQKFNTKQSERDEHLKLAEECLEEMHRLQGEYRVLQDMSSTHEATTITAKPAKEKK